MHTLRGIPPPAYPTGRSKPMLAGFFVGLGPAEAQPHRKHNLNRGSVAAVSGLALSLPKASAKQRPCRPVSGLALSGRLTASSSPKVGALGKGVKCERSA